MKSITAIALCTLATIASGSFLPGQGVQSGPDAGMKLTPVMVYASTGPLKGKEFDAAKEIGKRPGALLFVHSLTRENAQIIRNLDALAADFAVLGFRSFTTMLTGDRTFGEQRIQAVSTSLNMRNPMTVTLDGAEGPGDYALNRDANLTLVMVKGGVVKQSIGFTDTGAKDVPRLRAAIEAVAGKLPATREERRALLPDDPAELKRMIGDLWREVDLLENQLTKLRERNRNSRAQNNRRRNPGAGNRGGNQRGMQRGAQKQGEKRAGAATKRPMPGKIPEDETLVALLRAAMIRAKTSEAVEAAFAEVDKAVGEDPGRRQAMVDGFTRILGATTYGTDEARKRAKAYCEKYGAKNAKKKEQVR